MFQIHLRNHSREEGSNCQTQSLPPCYDSACIDALSRNEDARMGHRSIFDSRFREKVTQWIHQRSEVLVLIRYPGSAVKDFEFYQSVTVLGSRLLELTPRTSVIVFGERQLPLRGTVNEEFIQQATELFYTFPESQGGREYLVANLEQADCGPYSKHFHCAGETIDELLADLNGKIGELVAFGKYPPWLYDGEEVISAIVPDADGKVQLGIY